MRKFSFIGSFFTAVLIAVIAFFILYSSSPRLRGIPRIQLPILQGCEGAEAGGDRNPRGCPCAEGCHR